MPGGEPGREDAGPSQVAHFRILGRLGQGGMGIVYRAEDEMLRRLVALKLLPDASGDEETRQRFLREARSAAAITHPNVATVHQVGEAEGRIYIAMELVDGESLRARLARGRLDLATARDFAGQIAAGLSAAHDKEIMHRDLKPENIMVTPAGVVKLLDFGLAKAGDRRAPASTQAAFARTEAMVTSDAGRVMGTPEYMSPEQALGEPPDVRSDVFSLLYECFSGARPFAGVSAPAVLVAIARDPAPPLGDRVPGLDETTEAAIMRCLAKAPAERFANAGEVVLALSGRRSAKATTVSMANVAPVMRSETVRRRPGRSRARSPREDEPGGDRPLPPREHAGARVLGGRRPRERGSRGDGLPGAPSCLEESGSRIGSVHGRRRGARRRPGSRDGRRADRGDLPDARRERHRRAGSVVDGLRLGTETAGEARVAVGVLDQLHAPLPNDYTSASSRTLFLAGRGERARPLLERSARGCSLVLSNTQNWIRAHLYLGELDERSGAKATACGHYAKVIDRWGNAKPRSVTAEEARVRAAKLGCAP